MQRLYHSSFVLIDVSTAILTPVGRGGKLPQWYEQLRTQPTLPNLDSKTIGSVIESL